MQQRFFRTIPARLRATPRVAAAKGDKPFSIDIPGAYGVINKGDDAHCDFRLDFRDAIAHCDLVQRNNATSECYGCNLMQCNNVT
jgi:hypothetical protein